MKTFSIITPVYNGEKYIKACVESIAKCNYDLSLIEHIIVDDGSTDNTKTICESLALKYQHVKFYSKSNGNWGSVINYVKNNRLVHNDYAVICDADDTILPNAFTIVNKKCEDADMFFGSYICWNGKRKTHSISPFCFLFKRKLKKTKPYQYWMPFFFVPNIIYFKTENFYKTIDLQTNVMYQDGVLFLELYKYSNILKFTHKRIARYWEARGGATSSQKKTQKGFDSMMCKINYCVNHDCVEAFVNEMILSPAIATKLIKNKSSFAFKHKPKQNGRVWWTRFPLFLVYLFKIKKLIKY